MHGSLIFGAGDDTLGLYAGSTISGNVNGGGGTNNMILLGEPSSNDILTAITNFQSLTKIGEGKWILTGAIDNDSGGAALTAQIAQGTLALTGNNSNFNGSIRSIRTPHWKHERKACRPS